ncbi:MAG: hypothetical protein KY459_01530 [Acidobacteria bacterium]|nr:hypothetical protein [Acidobacteriota bacterium]
MTQATRFTDAELSKYVVCTACGYFGIPRSYSCVQLFVLIFLLLFGILPGLIYAAVVDAWKKRCPRCDNKSLIPATAPNAKAMIAEGRVRGAQ